MQPWYLGVYVDVCSHCLSCPQEEQAAKAKAEKIRVALEKIKEAQVKKVGVVKSTECVHVCALRSHNTQTADR